MNAFLEQFADDFYFMERRLTPDGYGTQNVEWHEGALLHMAVAHDTTVEASIAEQAGTASTFTFLCEKGTPLQANDIVKRVSDGQGFKITSSPEDEKTPAMSELNLAKVTAKKVVIV